MSKLEEHPEDTIQSRPISSTSNVHHDEKKVIYEGTTASVSPEQTSTLGEKNEDIEAHTPASGHSPRSPSPNIATTAERHEYLGPLALTALTLGICMSVFLLSLDRTIITTAIPYITNQFNSYDDVGWYGSSYLVTACALQPLYGRIFTLFNIKWSFLGAMAIFELGSFICGIAPNSVTLIIGRAIAGWGSAGILTGSFIVVAHSVPLQKRPVYTAAVGVMFGLGAIVGPLIGGVFTDLATWRWCFYVNLPCGAVTVIAMMWLFKPQQEPLKQPLIKKVLELDLIGNVILLIGSVMFFLALQYSSQHYSWSSPRVIGLLVSSGIILIIFIIWQRYRGDRALIPPRIINQRTVAASCCSAFFIYSAALIHIYYLPIWFQAIRGESAISSGVSMIGYMLSNALFSLLAGFVVSMVGYYTPPAIIGAAIGTVGCGLLTTLKVDSPAHMWIPYEFVAGAGLGIAIQQGFIAVQTVLPIDQLPIGTSAITAFQSAGGAVFISVGNSILQNELRSASNANLLPGVDIEEVIQKGATEFRSIVPAAALPELIIVYNRALQKVFTAAIPVAGLACIAACFLEWKSVRGDSKLTQPQEETDSTNANSFDTETTEDTYTNTSPQKETVRANANSEGSPVNARIHNEIQSDQHSIYEDAPTDHHSVHTDVFTEPSTMANSETNLDRVNIANAPDGSEPTRSNAIYPNGARLSDFYMVPTAGSPHYGFWREPRLIPRPPGHD